MKEGFTFHFNSGQFNGFFYTSPVGADGKVRKVFVPTAGTTIQQIEDMFRGKR